VCASVLRLVYLWGMGSPRVCGMRVYGHVPWPIGTSEPAVYVVSGGCPSATWLAREFARSLPIEWLCALILPRWVRMPGSQRVLRVCVMELSVSRWMLWRYANGQFMYPWIRRREHALSVRSWVWPSWRSMSMPASSTRLMVCEGGVEVTRILMCVSKAG
jgi:hypothetical protein